MEREGGREMERKNVKKWNEMERRLFKRKENRGVKIYEMDGDLKEL